jgi:hypothetical protein
VRAAATASSIASHPTRDALPVTPGVLTAQAPPCATTVLHTPAAQSAERHTAARSHAAPVGRFGVHVPLPQKSVAGQSLSIEHGGTFAWHVPVPPSGALQNFIGDMQSASEVQLVVHAPCGSHVGASLVQSAEVTQATQRFAVVLQSGVAPLHCESIRQATHSPWFGPPVAQRLERQTVAPLAPSHGPSPFW